MTETSEISNIALYPLDYNNEFYNFTMKWNSPKNGTPTDYFISVYPSPLYGATVTISNGTITTLSLQNGLIHVVTISTCPYMRSTSRFIIGINII